LEVEDWADVTKGVVPTFWGYGAHGLLKFGLNEVFKAFYTNILNEVFKDFYTNIAGEESLESSTIAKLTMWARLQQRQPKSLPTSSCVRLK
jgi:hypothetical protein